MALTKAKGSSFASDRYVGVSVKDFGAVGDGATDDTTAINNALTAGAGGVVWFPPGDYLISGTLNVPVGTSILGPGTCDVYNPATVGATISITHTSGDGVTLGRGAVFDGVNIYYPNQVTTSPPTAHDWAISIDFSDTAVWNGNNSKCHIRNCVIHNAYKGINLGGDFTDKIPAHGMEVLENIGMYALHTGISSGSLLVESFLKNVVLSPQFWTASIGTASRQWAMTNGNACIEYLGGQGLQMTDVTMFGHARGLYVHGTGIDVDLKSCGFHKSNNCIFDGLRICVEVAEEMGLIGTFTGCTFASKDPFNSGFTTAKGVYLNDNDYPAGLVFSGCEWQGTTGNHIHDVKSTSTAFNKLTFSGCAFDNANSGNDAGTYYNFYIDDTKTTLTVGASRIANTNDSSVVNFELLNAHTVTVTGNSIFDNVSTPFNIGTISNDLTIENNSCNVPIATASATTITLPVHENGSVQITGTTNIDTITAGHTNRPIVLYFGGALTMSDGAGNLVLNGAFTSKANDTITLMWQGTNWIEVARSVN